MLEELEKTTPKTVEALPEIDLHPAPSTASSPEERPAYGRYVLLGLVLLLIAIAAINLLTLLHTPPPFVDEGWNANRSWAFLHTGRAFGSLDAGVFEKYPGYWTYFPWLASAIHAVSMSILGPQLFAMRLVSVLFGLVLLVAVFVIANRLANQRTAFISVLLVAFSFSFIYSSHLGRHDIIVAAMGFSAIALYVTDESQNFSVKALLAGLIVALTTDIHLNGVIYIPVLGLLFLYDYKWAFLRSKRFWSFALGVSIGVFYFVAMHILPYPQTFFSLFSIGNGTGRTPPLSSLDPNVWLAALRYPIDLLDLRAVIVGMAIVYLLWKGSAGDRKLVFLMTMMFVVFLAVIRGKPIFYGILVAPAANLVAASFLDKVLGMPWRGSPVAFARTALVWGLAGAALILGSIPYLVDSTADTQVTFGRIGQSVPQSSSVMGPQTYWFALPDQPYYSWEQIVYYRRDNPGSTLVDAFRALRPDYLIIDRFMEGAVLEDAKLKEERVPFLYVPKADLDTFLSDQAHLVTSVETQTFGNVRVYKIDWK